MLPVLVDIGDTQFQGVNRTRWHTFLMEEYSSSANPSRVHHESHATYPPAEQIRINRLSFRRHAHVLFQRIAADGIHHADIEQRSFLF